MRYEGTPIQGDSGMTGYDTEQEAFWAGEFGDAYGARNDGPGLLARKTALFGRMLRGAGRVGAICEFGCNIGLNLQAIHDLQTGADLCGIEINAAAARAARARGLGPVVESSIVGRLDGVTPVDLTFTAGVLIHISPEVLPAVYANLVRLSRRFVLVCEYYNPVPVAVPYRGHEDRLFKRDFAGEMMDAHGLDLVDYGFAYRRDPVMPLDDLTWFLLRKPEA